MRTLTMVAYTIFVLPIIALGCVAALLYYPLLCGFLKGLKAAQWLTDFDSEEV